MSTSRQTLGITVAIVVGGLGFLYATSSGNNIPTPTAVLDGKYANVDIVGYTTAGDIIHCPSLANASKTTVNVYCGNRTPLDHLATINGDTVAE